MKRVVAAFLVACLAVPVIAIEVNMSEEEQAVCDQQGGCMVMTAHRLQSLVNKAFNEGMQRGKSSCGGRSDL